ncbi:MAG: EpsG family protein [Bacteroides sp.]|nr:EpsG family protein [Bacteroides sp.]
MGILEIDYNKYKYSKIITVILATILIIFAGLKTDGSTDYVEYKFLFDRYTDYSNNEFIEPGYQFLMLLTHWYSNNFIIFTFIIAIISISLKSIIFYRLTPYVSVAFLMYLCGCFFERDNDGIRQGLSISFCFVGLYYLIDNNIKKYIIFTLLACSIHYSSFIFFGALLLRKIKWSTKTIIFIVSIAYIISLVGGSLTAILIRNIPIIMVAEKVSIYSSNSYSESIGISIGILFRTLILILFMLNYNRININNTLFLILRNGLALSIILSLLFGDFAIISHRLPYVFREFQIFIVSYLISAFNRIDYKICGLLIVFIYTCIILNRFLIEGSIYNNYKNLLF